jgi:hypothetical protein
VRSSRSMRWRGSRFGHSPTCRSDEQFGAKVRASFLASDRTYGARGGVARHASRRCVVWAASNRAFDAATGSQSPVRHGVDCRTIWVSGRSPPSRPTCSTALSRRPLATANGAVAWNPPWSGRLHPYRPRRLKGFAGRRVGRVSRRLLFFYAGLD